jgi:hypothetical protein
LRAPGFRPAIFVFIEPRFPLRAMSFSSIRQCSARAVLQERRFRFEFQSLEPRIFSEFHTRFLRGPERRRRLTVHGKLHQIDRSLIIRVDVFGEMNQFVSWHAHTIGHKKRANNGPFCRFCDLEVYFFGKRNSPAAIWITHYTATDAHQESDLAPISNRLRRRLIVTSGITDADPLDLRGHRINLADSFSYDICLSSLSISPMT